MTKKAIAIIGLILVLVFLNLLTSCAGAASYDAYLLYTSTPTPEEVNLKAIKMNAQNVISNADQLMMETQAAELEAMRLTSEARVAVDNSNQISIAKTTAEIGLIREQITGTWSALEAAVLVGVATKGAEQTDIAATDYYRQTDVAATDQSAAKATDYWLTQTPLSATAVYLGSQSDQAEADTLLAKIMVFVWPLAVIGTAVGIVFAFRWALSEWIKVRARQEAENRKLEGDIKFLQARIRDMGDGTMTADPDPRGGMTWRRVISDPEAYNSRIVEKPAGNDVSVSPGGVTYTAPIRDPRREVLLLLRHSTVAMGTDRTNQIAGWRKLEKYGWFSDSWTFAIDCLRNAVNQDGNSVGEIIFTNKSGTYLDGDVRTVAQLKAKVLSKEIVPKAPPPRKGGPERENGYTEAHISTPPTAQHTAWDVGD